MIILSMGIREALYEEGLRIPEDVALMSFDDTILASLSGIELTTISQNKYEMGAMGLKFLSKK